MTLQATAEQDAILTALAGPGPVRLAINAGPGCGKTSTIMLCIQALTQARNHTWKPEDCKIAYLVFNKDMKAKADRDLQAFGINKGTLFRAQSLTLNSQGHRLWDSLTFNPAKRMDVTDRKMGGIFRDIATNSTSHTFTQDDHDNLKTLARFAKSQGYLPPSSGSPFKSQATFETLCSLAEILPEPFYRPVLDQALKTSIKQAFNRTLDFDDQLYMPALFGADLQGMTNLEWLFVDEAQDLNPIQHFMISRLKPTNLVVVGDPLQAIYSFRGAMPDSMAKLTAEGFTHLPLQVSFRLPKTVTHLLNKTNDRLTTAKDLPGLIKTITAPVSLDELHETYYPKDTHPTPQPSAIICRNNAPLYKAALACIGANLPFTLSDSTWGQSLVKDITKKFQPADLPFINPDAMISALMSEWTAKGLSTETITDRRMCLLSLAQAADCTSAAQVLNALKNLLTKSSTHPTFILSTAHKAKGQEYPLVVHLSPSLIPSKFATTPEALAQETNIAYVINSRTLDTLVFLEATNLIVNPHGLSTSTFRPRTNQRQPLP